MISHFLRKAEVLEEDKDMKKMRQGADSKKRKDLPLPPPPPEFLEKFSDNEELKPVLEFEKESKEENLDEILKDFETDFTAQKEDVKTEEPESIKLEELEIFEKTSLTSGDSKTKEGIDVLVRTLKAGKERADIDSSGCETVVKSVFDRKIALYVLIEKGQKFYETGDKNFANSVRIVLENLEPAVGKEISWNAEFEEESFTGHVEEGFSVSLVCDRKKTGVAKIEIGKIISAVRENL